MTHLDSLELRLSHERIRLANAKTESERHLREVWVAQITKEIADELAFLGRNAIDAEMPDDDLLAALAA